MSASSQQFLLALWQSLAESLAIVSEFQKCAVPTVSHQVCSHCRALPTMNAAHSNPRRAGKPLPATVLFVDSTFISLTSIKSRCSKRISALIPSASGRSPLSTYSRRTRVANGSWNRTGSASSRQKRASAAVRSECPAVTSLGSSSLRKWRNARFCLAWIGYLCRLERCRAV